MFKNLPWILVAVLAIALALMFIFRPEKQDAVIERLEHENDSLLIRISQHQENAERLSRKRLTDSLQSIQNKKVSDSIHSADRATIAKLRSHPKVLEVIKEVPEIDTLIQAYDSALLHKDERIRELESELTSSQQLASQAELNFQATIKDYQALNSNLHEQISHWQKEAKKQKRLKKLTIVGGVVFSLGSLLLGSNL